MNEHRFYIGGYARPGQPGLLKCRLDLTSSRLETLSENTELLNPSWVLAHPEKPVVYAVEEDKPEGRLAVMDMDGDTLRKRASLPTGGADPCHICLSPEGRHLLVSNYSSGSLAVFALDAEGLPAGMTDFHQHEMDDAARQGANPLRQEAPHVHFCAFHGGQAYVNDLGLNRIVVYDWDGTRGRLTPAGASIPFPAGSGPRHSAFGADGKTLCALCELTAMIHVFRWDGGWQPTQRASIVSEDFAAFEAHEWSTGAAIRQVDARTLCATARGDNTLAVFDIAPDGRLTLRQLIALDGRTPRDFNAFGDALVVALQDSGRVVVYRKDAGSLYQKTDAEMPAVKPTCVAKI